MVVYDIRCSHDHVFEAWFPDSAAFDAQAAAGHVTCPTCGDTRVVRAPMAPNISTGKGDAKRRELAEQVSRVDAFVGAVGSAGMLIGVSHALKEAGRSTRIIALEPSTSPFLTTGKAGAHRVEGTAAGFWPPHLTKDMYDEVRVIDEDEGRAMARRVAKEEGVFAGTSSGVNIAAAVALAKELGPGKVVATVACDTGLKYLAGDLFK